MPTIFLSLLIFVSCTSQPTAPTPDWVLTSNSNSNHWIGVGSIKKPFSGNIREAARSQAVNEIASQISIQILSNFRNVKTEYNYDINEFSKSIIDSRVCTRDTDSEINLIEESSGPLCSKDLDILLTIPGSILELLVLTIPPIPHINLTLMFNIFFLEH